MTSTKLGPLRVEAPPLVADVALGEHLAALARASTPSAASRVRRSGWKVPLAAIATIAASGGVAYAGESALHGHIAPRVPAIPIDAARPHLAEGTASATASATVTETASHKPLTPLAKVVGHRHPSARGHSDKDDRPAQRNPGDTSGGTGRERDNSLGQATTVPTFDIPPWRNAAGSAGASARDDTGEG